MRKKLLLCKNKFLLFILLLFTLNIKLSGQTANQYQPFSHQFYQKLNHKIYDTNTRFHSAIKPYFLDDSIIALSVDSAFNISLDTGKQSWVKRKFRANSSSNLITPCI